MGKHRFDVLVVDDSDVDREVVRRLLGDEYSFVEAVSIEEARALAEERRPRCALVDYRLPDGTGLELLPDLLDQGIPVIILTGQGAEETAVAAVKAGASDYLVKERLKSGSLRKAVNYASETARLAGKVEHQAAEIRASEARLASFLDALPIGVWVLDNQGEPFLTNRFADEVLGPPGQVLSGPTPGGAILNAYIADTDEPYPLQRLPIVRALSGESSEINDLEIERNGKRLRLAATARPIRDAKGAIEYAIAAFRDITRHVRLEEKYRHAQKMEAIGRTAGAVAHDFNNILTAIYSFGGFVLRELDDDSPARGDMEEVLKAASRAETLTRQLLAFSRKKPIRPQQVNLSELVEGIRPMGERILGEDVELELELEPDLWPVHVDPGMFEHAIVNLVVNARDAMPRGGRIRIRTRNDRGMLPDDFVELLVEDNGTGMSAATRSKAMEPFFTTKAGDGGTGLGLATCYGIVKQAGGRIGIDSSLGVGTTIRIRLPRSEGREAARTAEPLQRTTSSGGNETVLLVEDSLQVRRATARMLKAAGYKVLVAENGNEGIELCRRHGDEIKLVLSDVVMPGMSGREFVLEALELVPDVRVVFMSGYNDRVIERHGALDDGIALLQKPFDAKDLLATVRARLDVQEALVLGPRKHRVLVFDQSGWAGRIPPTSDREVIVTSDPDVALNRATTRHHDAILWDLTMPCMKGVDYFELARRICPEVEDLFVFITETVTDDVRRAVEARTGRPVCERPSTGVHLDEAVAVTTDGRVRPRTASS